MVLHPAYSFDHFSISLFYFQQKTCQKFSQPASASIPCGLASYFRTYFFFSQSNIDLKFISFFDFFFSFCLFCFKMPQLVSNSFLFPVIPNSFSGQHSFLFLLCSLLVSLHIVTIIYIPLEIHVAITTFLLSLIPFPLSADGLRDILNQLLLQFWQDKIPDNSQVKVFATSDCPKGRKFCLLLSFHLQFSEPCLEQTNQSTQMCCISISTTLEVLTKTN